MKTYPTYPQPIIQQAGGLNWYLEVTPGGTLRAGGTTTDPPTPLARLKLVDPTGQAAYRIGLDGSTPPLVTATALTPASSATHKDLPVWGINGREWNLRVTSAGSITIKAIATDWPMAQQPRILDTDGKLWQLNVTDAGIMETDGPTVLPIMQSTGLVKLRADDDSGSFQVTVDTAGILYVEGPNDVNDAQHYETLLISPTGFRFPLSVDAAGLLSIDASMQEIDAQDQWPLVLQWRTGVLYVVDSRFRAPVPRGSGRGYGRRGA